MSAPSASVSSPLPLLIAQLESSTSRRPSSVSSPAPVNHRRVEAARRRQLVTLHAMRATASDAAPRGRPSAHSATGVLPPIGSRRASLAENALRQDLVRSVLSSSPNPPAAPVPPLLSTSQVWVLPEYTPPACVLISSCSRSPANLSIQS